MPSFVPESPVEPPVAVRSAGQGGPLTQDDLPVKGEARQGSLHKYEVFIIDLEFPTHKKFVFFPLTLLAGFSTQTNTHVFIDKSEGVY